MVSSLNHDLDAVDLNALELSVKYAAGIVNESGSKSWPVR